VRVLVSLLVFIRLPNTLPYVKIYVMEPNVFLGYLKRGIACLMNPFGHEQYPSNSLDRNNWCYNVSQWGYYIPSKFCQGYAILLQVLKDMIWSPNYLRLPKMTCYTFIEYFVLWTWVKHTLTMSKLNWSSTLLW
jgi:hypothetical protein